MSTAIKRLHPGPTLCRAVEYGNLVFIAGTTATNRSVDAKAQTEEILKKIDDLLAECGTDKSKLLSANVWIAEMSEKPLMDAAWQAWVDPNNKPVRACVEAKLGTAETRVEIMVTAAK